MSRKPDMSDAMEVQNVSGADVNVQEHSLVESWKKKKKKKK
jgi:hypothetical protein